MTTDDSTPQLIPGLLFPIPLPEPEPQFDTPETRAAFQQMWEQISGAEAEGVRNA